MTWLISSDLHLDLSWLTVHAVFVMQLCKGISKCWPAWNDSSKRSSSFPETHKWTEDLASKLIAVGNECSYGAAGFVK